MPVPVPVPSGAVPDLPRTRRVQACRFASALPHGLGELRRDASHSAFVTPESKPAAPFKGDHDPHTLIHGTHLVTGHGSLLPLEKQAHG